MVQLAVRRRSQSFVAFGIPAISPTEPISLALSSLEHRDAAVRDGGMRLLLSLRRAVGERLLDRNARTHVAVLVPS